MSNLFRCDGGKQIKKLYFQKICLYTGNSYVTYTDANNITRKRAYCYFKLPEGVKRIAADKLYVLNGGLILYGTNSFGREIEIAKYGSNTDTRFIANVPDYTDVYFYAYIDGASGGANPSTNGTSYIEGVSLIF